MQYYINALKDLDLSWITLTNITKVLAFVGIGLSKSYNLKNKQKKVSSFPLLFWRLRFSLWCINSLPINTVRETKVVEESSFSVKINGLKLKGRRFICIWCSNLIFQFKRKIRFSFLPLQAPQWLSVASLHSTANMTRSLIANKNIPLSPEKAGLKLVL